ncbi:MAG: hypothetical protein WBN55_15970 [Eudoraea sp.]|uniref:hypothetical protein n=1 Tax=Eudoraea sp. TaxID=1979955 RepID=UPI003C70AAB0
MKTIIKLLFTLLILFAFSCSQESTQDPLPADLDGVSAKTNSKATLDVSGAIGESGVEGSATLHRNKNGITVNVKTSGLTPGYAYTLWIVAFNNQDGVCDPTGCTPGDSVDAEAEIMYGAGHVVGGSGKGNFSAHLNENDVSGSVNVEHFEIPTVGGMMDAQKAEIHVVVRCHGPAIPGMIKEQIQSYDGGCDMYECNDVWFGIFL